MKTRGLFVTATDTGVGKTYVAALIARSLRSAGRRVGAYKPVCSGSTLGTDGSPTWGDVEILSDAIGGEFSAERICPRLLSEPLAPPVAARIEGRRLELGPMAADARWWLGRVEMLLVEGVGGLLCPLTETETIADLAMNLGFPLLIVARAGLGTINHTLLTVEGAQRRGLTVSAVLLNECEPLPPKGGLAENATEIARRTNVPVLGVVRHHGESVTTQDGREAAVDWSALIDRRPGCCSVLPYSSSGSQETGSSAIVAPTQGSLER